MPPVLLMVDCKRPRADEPYWAHFATDGCEKGISLGCHRRSSLYNCSTGATEKRAAAAGQWGDVCFPSLSLGKPFLPPHGATCSRETGGSVGQVVIHKHSSSILGHFGTATLFLLVNTD